MWEEQDVWLRAWSKLLGQLDELLGRCPFWTRLLSPPKKGLAVGTTRHGKGTKCVAVVDGRGVPVGAQLALRRFPNTGLQEALSIR
jgi:hypothetical protein